MKSLIRRIFCFIGSILILFSLSSCTAYESMEDYESGIVFGYSKLKNDCFAGPIIYTKNGTTEITVPNTFNGAPVTKLGGYTGTGYPTPFFVNCDEFYFPEGYHNEYSTDDETLNYIIDENTILEIENIVFRIKLPDTLEEIVNTELKTVAYAEKNDGDIKTLKVFRPVYYFEISENNDTFYTKDGKLYYKETDELFSNCIYESGDYGLK